MARKVRRTAHRRQDVPDVLAPGLLVVFCGINPGLMSGRVGHHFARPGNRFWPALHRSGWTDRQLAPAEDALLPRFGCGVTNIASRTTAGAADLTAEELTEGARRLRRNLRRFRPRAVAFLGVTAYRVAFGERSARIGPQADAIDGCRVWVLPNPSGRNAHHRLEDFVRLFRRLRRGLPPRDGRRRAAPRGRLRARRT